jgi:hypothetical protein
VRGLLAPVVALVAVAVISGCGSSVPTASPASLAVGTLASSPSAPVATTAPIASPATAGTQSPSRSASPAPHLASVVGTVDYGVGASAYPNAQAAVAGFGSLWIPFYASPRGWLVRIDIATRRVVARIHVGESPDSVAIVGNDVWVANTIGDASRAFSGQNTLSRIDPATNRVVQVVHSRTGS